jgi:hypothetical protein
MALTINMPKAQLKLPKDFGLAGFGNPCRYVTGAIGMDEFA